MEKQIRVLVVDDNIGLSRTLALILGRKGCVVTTAADGPEAIEKVKAQAFDIVLMDIRMPVMDGVEAYRQIKAIRPGIAAIMMTAFSVEELIQQALAEGAYRVIRKPLDIDQVMALIEQATEAKAGALILVVDDDPGARTTFKNVLSRKGFTVGVASTGEEALSLAELNRYDILFIDVRLPAMNGLETYLAIRRVNPTAVAIIMTGYRQEVSELVQQALSQSAYACLYKPFDVDEVLALVAEIQRTRGSNVNGGRL